MHSSEQSATNKAIGGFLLLVIAPDAAAWAACAGGSIKNCGSAALDLPWLQWAKGLKIAAKGTDAAKGANKADHIPAGGVHPLRQAYIDEVEGLTAKQSFMIKAGRSPEEIARALHADRRALGVKYKNLTPPDKLEEIYERNVGKYGDKLGPTIEYLRAQGKSWDQIAASSARTGGADLGLGKKK